MAKKYKKIADVPVDQSAYESVNFLGCAPKTEWGGEGQKKNTQGVPIWIVYAQAFEKGKPQGEELEVSIASQQAIETARFTPIIFQGLTATPYYMVDDETGKVSSNGVSYKAEAVKLARRQ